MLDRLIGGLKARPALWLLAALLSGCATPISQTLLRPVMVKVPVPEKIYCPVAPIAKPALPIAALKPDSSAADTVRAYGATVAILKGALSQRDQLLAACAKP